MKQTMSIETRHAVFYTPLQRRLHWLVIVLLVLQYSLQVPMRSAMSVIERGDSLTFFHFMVTTLHTWGGISIAAIMIWRWQLRRRFVPLEGGRLAGFTEKLVRAHHVSLYGVILLMATAGAVHYYIGWEVAGRLHVWGKWLLLVLVGVHIAGALSHLGGGSTVFKRMMGSDSLR